MRKTSFKEMGPQTGPARLPAYQFDILRKFSDRIAHAVFTRDGGVSNPPFDSLNVRFGIGDPAENVRKNRSLICDAIGVAPENLVSAEQTHGKNVQIVDGEFLLSAEHRSATRADKEVHGVDAFVTNVPGVALMIQVADCQALLLYDPATNVAAAVHAGWKGLALDIIGETLQVMKKRYGVDPSRVLAGIAPSLGPCCAFFSDPEKELPFQFHSFIDDQKRVDLWSFSLQQLQKHGIRKEHIELARVCTQCNGFASRGGGNMNRGGDMESPGRFFSFRGEKGVTGRFGVLIMLRP